jgi:type I restriction enzyme S subunit
VEKDDFVISMRSFQGGLERAWAPGCIRSSYVVLKPSPEARVDYFAHLFKSLDYIRALQATSNFIRDGQDLNFGNFCLVDLPLPPQDEQAAIARFLDHANRKIDGFIRAKRKLIGLLNERKQVIIHQAVTRGLNPDAPLKPSGIPWLGDIPEHWQTPLNRQLFRENIRPHNGKPERQLSLSQRDGLIATAEMQERSLQTSTFDNWKVTIPGDLVLNRFKAHLGVFFASTLRGMVSFHYGVFAPQRPLNTKYFELLFHTVPFKIIYAGRSNGMTVGLQNLSNQNFYGVRSIFPPIREQDEIVAHAQTATFDLEKAISRVQREIALVQEYRTRLTADIVTGKLDVREAAAKLPDLPTESATDEGLENLETEDA